MRELSRSERQTEYDIVREGLLSAPRAEMSGVEISRIEQVMIVPLNHNRNVTEIRLWALPEAITRGPQGPA